MNRRPVVRAVRRIVYAPRHGVLSPGHSPGRLLPARCPRRKSPLSARQPKTRTGSERCRAVGAGPILRQVRPPLRRAAFVLAGLSALVLLDPAPGLARPRKSNAGEEEKGRPRLRLSVDRAVGFAPIKVVLTGELVGVDPQDANFCHAAVTWTRVDPGQTLEEGTRVRESAACLHPKEQIFVPTSFTKEYTLYAPGSYLFRLAVEGKDGKRLTSGYAKVEALRSE